jgi:hypothetical protein
MAQLTHDLFSYSAKEIRFIDVPEMLFAVADGKGSPEQSTDFRDVIGALYSISYGLRFALKADGVDYRVSMLEGLFWTADGSPLGSDETAVDPADLIWRLMLWQPDEVTPERFEHMREEASRKAAKKGKPLPGLERVRLERFAEGACAQVLHVGPYDAEGPTIARLHAAISAAGRELRGLHHEIYLSGPTTAPARTKTSIRQPVG